MRITELTEGSVRRAADFVRVNVQLEEAESGEELWADRFNADPGFLRGLG